MPHVPCPECHRDCEVDAQQCAACGARLQAPLNLPDASEPVATHPDPVFTSGAIWFDDLDADIENAPPVHLTLRALDGVAPAPSATEPAVAADAPAADVEMPEGVVADPMAPREDSVGPPVYDEIVLPSPGPSPQALEKQRAERRASVRRSRLRALAAKNGLGDRVPEVLVVDEDDGHRAQLVTLLLAFGFGVHSAASPEKALTVLESTTFVAVFADVELDGERGGAGIEMCRRAKELADETPTLLVYVAKSADPIGRIRAQLAGCDDMIVKPLVRGNVAGVLDMHGIVLPSDARRV
jgi:CheY-like chemotaxis protein